MFIQWGIYKIYCLFATIDAPAVAAGYTNFEVTVLTVIQ